MRNKEKEEEEKMKIEQLNQEFLDAQNLRKILEDRNESTKDKIDLERTKTSSISNVNIAENISLTDPL